MRLGRLQTASDIRKACRRIGNATLEGRVAPRVANSALYAIAGAAKAREIEVAEELARKLAALDGVSQVSLARESVEHLPSISSRVLIEAEVATP